MVYSYILLAVLLLLAALSDIRTRTISNRLNLVIALLAPLAWWEMGLSLYPDIAWQIGAALIVFAVFFALFAVGGIGGGDVKMVAAMALWLPAAMVLPAMMVMAYIGGGIALAMLIHRKWRKIQGVSEVPYGVAIAAAGLWVICQQNINQFPPIPLV
jgi:prepilin peptidase CpaA